MHVYRREDGFTFNEVLVSISIISIAILGYSLGTVGMMRGAATSGNYTTAVNLAQDKIEELRAQTLLQNADQCTVAHDRVGLAGAGPSFNRCWTIADSPLGTELKDITVKISWRDYEQREISLSTVIFTD